MASLTLFINCRASETIDNRVSTSGTVITVSEGTNAVTSPPDMLKLRFSMTSDGVVLESKWASPKFTGTPSFRILTNEMV